MSAYLLGVVGHAMLTITSAGESHEQYNQVYDNDGQQQDHQGSLGHEVIAGGASFAAFKAFEDHQRKEGKPVSHAFAKELLAGFAGAEVDKLAETKGVCASALSIWTNQLLIHNYRRMPGTTRRPSARPNRTLSSFTMTTTVARTNTTPT